uniref:Uncharacterized protein n=1 Tax=Avena sativa TaxID=4498 RepID=A0ACD6AEL8_AVESA
MAGYCTDDALADFSRVMGGQMLRVNALMVVNAILMGVMVGIGAYGHRYRHHPLIRFLFLGATILFLPIVSYIISITSNQQTIAVPSRGGHITVIGYCSPNVHMILILVWTALVQIVGINTTAIVATDAREGRSIAPPAVLLVQAIWTTYLGFGIIENIDFVRQSNLKVFVFYLVILAPFSLIFAKIFLKYYAWYSATHSFAFGRNPRLIVGYMMQLPDRRHHAEVASGHTPPPLIVSREDTVLVEKQPHGYRMCSRGDTARINNKGGLVTIDKVWELDDILLKSTTQLKDVCFSFALFKMLRCRFAKYVVREAGFMKAHNFLWHLLLEDSDDKRILGVIASELSFLHDYYYSSLAISYSKNRLPIWNIFISLLTIVYCLLCAIDLITLAVPALKDMPDHDFKDFIDIFTGQLSCVMSCIPDPPQTSFPKDPHQTELAGLDFGNFLFDLLPLLSLTALVVLSEVREIASYICSDWTKVALMCRYVSWHEYPTWRKWIGKLLECRCKLPRPWKNKMNQCSILVLHPRNTPVDLLRRLIPLPEQKKNIKVPREVQTAIVSTLRSMRGDLSNDIKSAQQLGIQVGDTFLQACNTKGTSDALLAWHVATSILEVRYPHPTTSSSDDHSVATKLSRYCAYLVAYSPELLPDDDAWSSDLYKATKKDALRVLSAAPAVTSTLEMEYRQLVELLLGATSKNNMLKDGAKLREQLVELMEGEEAAWKTLAGFWSKTILYIAPSDNLEGHAEAIARGGELITLLWALLAHLGVDRRPESTADTTTTMDASGII